MITKLHTSIPHGRCRNIVSMATAILLFICQSASAATVADFEQQYDRLLKQYWKQPVEIHGIRTTVFDYVAMQRDAGRPDSLFTGIRETLAAIDPSAVMDHDEAKAFWINAYNFGAFQLFIAYYPVDSIRSFRISLFGHPWSRKVLRIGNRDYSLAEIEKDILLNRYGDVRILFAVSCASVSCPDRTPEAFTAARLDRQLDETIRIFLANPRKGSFLDREAGTLTLSWILKKDREWFSDENGGVRGFILSYLPDEEREWLRDHDVDIRYFDHDWTLNDIAQAD